jgi:hypothetical protein
VIGVLKGAVKSLQAIAGVSVNIIDIEKPGVGADACGDGFHKSTRKKPTKGGEGRKTTPNERNSLAFDSSMEKNTMEITQLLGAACLLTYLIYSYLSASAARGAYLSHHESR